jgi:hypothetical protein
MKRTIALCAFFLLSSLGLSAQLLDFTLANTTGRTIGAVYVSALGHDEWSPCAFDRELLAAKGRARLSLDPLDGAVLLGYGLESYDLKVEYEEGPGDIFRQVRLVDVATVTLGLTKDGHPVASSRP